MPTEEITGVGFGLYSPEEGYIVLVDDDGSERGVQAHNLVPEASRVSWAYYEALTGGFGLEHSAHVLERETADNSPPRACRVKITIETEELSAAETEALLAKARAKKTAP